MNDNLYALLASRFPADRGQDCLVVHGGRTWSYADLDRESARIANLLVALGLKKGDRVAVQVEKSAQAVFLYLACLRAGCVFLPLNTAYQRDEIGYFLKDAEPGLFVCRPQTRALAEELAEERAAATGTRVMILADDGSGELAEAAAKHGTDFATVQCGGDDLAAILYTSGTTGRSKGAMLSHRNLAANGLVLHEYWAWKPGDVLLHALPIFHVHGLFVALHCALLNGSTLLFHGRFDPKQVLADLPRASVFMGVPTYYVRLLAEPGFTREACAHMRLFVSGSAPLLMETFDEFRSRTGHVILERYGMTETGMLTSNPYAGERRGGTVGFALPGVSVRVAGDDGAAAKPGEIGHIQVRGDNVFSGYWRMPEKTREEFTGDGYFRTGDMGAVSADGYISIIGRSKDLIISGGLNVYPKEIELLLDSLPGVRESAVIGLPHPDFGEAVAAVIVRGPGGAALSAEGVIAEVKGRLANFKVPKQVFFVDDLPRNTMGKVQKNILRQQYAGV